MLNTFLKLHCPTSDLKEEMTDYFEVFSSFEKGIEEPKTVSSGKNMTHFSLINDEQKAMLKGTEAFNSYGNMPNSTLLMTYGFCYENNPHNEYEVKVRIDFP